MAVREKEVLNTRKMERIEYVGLAVLGLSLAVLFFKPAVIGGIFDAMVNKAAPIIVKVYLTGTLAVAIILSVMTGRILERLGFTDALIRIFVPLAKLIKITPLVIVPAIYNILGDINAAGRITAPYLKKVGATKDEQKIAIATMCQGNQSFSTLMLGILAFAQGGIWAFPVILFGLFLPVILVPLLLKLTVYRDVKFKDISDMPRFTPTTPIVPTIFNGAREGAELVFLVIIPAAAVVFAIMGVLDYIGIWKPIESALTSLLTALSIDPETGIQSVLVSPTLAMNTLVQTIKNIPPRLAVGSFIVAASGFPLQVPFAQIPAVWAQNSDLNTQEALEAATLGIVIRLLSALLFAVILTPIVV